MEGIGSGPKPKVSGFYTDIHRKDYKFQGYESWIDNLLEECCQDIQSLLVIWKRKNWLIVRTQKLFQIQCFKRKIFTSAPRKEKVMHGCTNRVIWTGRFAPETRWEILYSAGVTHKERLRCTYRVDRQIKKLRSFFASKNSNCQFPVHFFSDGSKMSYQSVSGHFFHLHLVAHNIISFL